MKTYYFFIVLLLNINFVFAQNLAIHGKIIDKDSQAPIPYAMAQIKGTGLGSVANEEGIFTINKLSPGAYTIIISSIGYKSFQTTEYLLQVHDLNITVELQEDSKMLNEVVVRASPFKLIPDSPTSLHIISIQEIEKSPGANRDISRIVQSYPGVSFSPASYRNDLIVRGGSPSENSFYLDGIEIPNINHFSTQGASGGPVGLINADLIREVNFYTGSFPALYENTLSSVLSFKLREGELEKNNFKATLGASEFSIASEGHLNSKTSYLISVRRSYLQFLFKQLGLPFLPTYTDALFKIKRRINQKNEISFIGLGGLDNLKLNEESSTDDAEYILGYLPTVKQEIFTLGSIYKHYQPHHVQSIILSHSYMNNRNEKYNNNENSDPEQLRFKYSSLETQTKLYLEEHATWNNWNMKIGLNSNYSYYTNNTLQKIYYNQQAQTEDYQTKLSLFRYGIFATTSYTAPNNKYSFSLGIRTDACGYSDKLNNPLRQISPRASFSYQVLPKIYLSTNWGIYYQLPQLTALGYKDNNNTYTNKDLKYIKERIWTLGVSYKPLNKIEFTIEGFHKNYQNIPFSIIDQIPLSCKGDDYGVIGAEDLQSTAQSKAYGIELMGRYIQTKKINIFGSLTFFRSKARNNTESDFIPSAWDTQFIGNISGTYYLPSNWSIGLKAKAIGGSPYTPYDLEKTALVEAWDAQGQPYYDYNKFNSLRNDSYYQIDLRIDKSFYLKRFMLGFYLDLQNVIKNTYNRPDILISTGKIINPSAPHSEQKYELKNLSQDSGTLLPTIGITIEL